MDVRNCQTVLYHLWQGWCAVGVELIAVFGVSLVKPFVVVVNTNKLVMGLDHKMQASMRHHCVITHKHKQEQKHILQRNCDAPQGCLHL